MTDSFTAQRPPGRYGTDRGVSPWLVAAIVVLAVVFVGAVISIGWRLSHPPVSVTLQGFEVLDDSTVEVRYLVVRDDPGLEVDCVVRARDRAHNEVGREVVATPPGRSEVVVTHSLRTASLAVMGEVVDCRPA